MSKRLLLATIAALYMVLVAHCQPASADDANTSSPPHYLQGSVKHSENLSPVPAALQAGSTYDEQALPPLNSSNNWIPIPAWLAGTWQFKTENVTNMTNYTRENYKPAPYTIRNESEKIWGQQKDKTGQIWHYLKAPYSYTSKLNNGKIGYERVTSTEVLSNDENIVNLKLTGTDTTVNTSHVVVNTDQSEEFHTYTRGGSDEVVNSGSAKFFDMEGKPTIELVSYMKARRLKPFTVIDDQDGENLKQLFIDFLKSHGKADLIP